MNERQQYELENYLREFRPCTPRRSLSESPFRNWRRLAAAAAIFSLASASIGGAFRHHDHNAESIRASAAKGPDPATVSTIPLTKLALENPQKFEAIISDASLRILPKINRHDSSLQLLAKE